MEDARCGERFLAVEVAVSRTLWLENAGIKGQELVCERVANERHSTLSTDQKAVERRNEQRTIAIESYQRFRDSTRGANETKSVV